MNKQEKADYIKSKRLELGIDVKQMEFDLGISSSRLNQYESGSYFIGQEDLSKIASYLKLDRDLLGIVKDKPRQIPKDIKQLFSYESYVDITNVPKLKNLLKEAKSGTDKRLKKHALETLELQLFRPQELEGIKPFLFFRFFIVIAVLLLATWLSEDLVLSNLAFSILVPGTLMILMFELNFARDLKGVYLFVYFFIGGTLSIFVTYMLREYVGYPNIFLLQDYITALVEETAKILIVYYFLSKLKVKFVYTGILIGFAVGAGFDSFETSSYGLFTLIDTNLSYFDMYVNIFFRSIYALLGIGHHFWTGLLGGALVLVNKSEQISGKSLVHPLFLFMFFLVVNFHALWNFSSDPSYAYIGYIVIALSLYTFYRFTKTQYVNDLVLIKEHLSEMSENEG